MAAPAPRTSQVAVQQASSSGFLSSIGVKVDGTDALSERLGTSGLKVVEAYSEAWGPCGSVGTLLKLFLAEEAPPAGAVEVLVCVSEGNSLLEKQFAKTSVPHFLFFRNGLLRQTVAGADVPALQKALKAHLPREGDPTDDPALNRFAPTPVAPPRPGTAGARPRTADLLKAGRAQSVVGPLNAHADPQRSAAASGGGGRSQSVFVPHTAVEAVAEG